MRIIEKLKARRLLRGAALAVALVWTFMASTAIATGFADETLHYVVTYKWGLVNKDAGDATLTLRGHGDRYNLRLTARTKPWADKVFMVRDTLLSTVSRQGFRPLSYSKISHEDGKYRRDDITYSRSGSTTTAKVKRVKRDRKGASETSHKTFSAAGEAYDMLSVFYYLRTLDYAALARGEVAEVPVFSGSKVERLTIRYAGRERLQMRDKTYRDAIRIKFRFTTDGRKKSSDDIEAWISADAAHIPLQLVGKLPLGSVRVYLL